MSKRTLPNRHMKKKFKKALLGAMRNMGKLRDEAFLKAIKHASS